MRERCGELQQRVTKTEWPHVAHTGATMILEGILTTARGCNDMSQIEGNMYPLLIGRRGNKGTNPPQDAALSPVRPIEVQPTARRRRAAAANRERTSRNARERAGGVVIAEVAGMIGAGERRRRRGEEAVVATAVGVVTAPTEGRRGEGGETAVRVVVTAAETGRRRTARRSHGVGQEAEVAVAVEMAAVVVRAVLVAAGMRAPPRVTPVRTV